jgi:hypothetical protein
MGNLGLVWGVYWSLSSFLEFMEWKEALAVDWRERQQSWEVKFSRVCEEINTRN